MLCIDTVLLNAYFAIQQKFSSVGKPKLHASLTDNHSTSKMCSLIVSESSKRICTLVFTLDLVIDLHFDINKIFKPLVHLFFFQKKKEQIFICSMSLE